MARKKDYDNACRLMGKFDGEDQRKRLVGWQLPSIGMVKLNTDGACLNSGVAGCGGLIRDHDGKWIKGYSKYLGSCNSLLAEFWGVYEGLKLIKALGFGKVEINTDAQVVVNAIRIHTINKIDCQAILREICYLMEELELVIVMHTYRDTNQCADILANLGCTCQQLCIYDNAPRVILRSLEADLLGLISPREGSS